MTAFTPAAPVSHAPSALAARSFAVLWGATVLSQTGTWMNDIGPLMVMVDYAVPDAARPAFAPLIARPREIRMRPGPRRRRVILFGGEPMEGPRWIWWNFASLRFERIEQAKEELAHGGFDIKPGDDAKFIPLPEGPGKPRRAGRGRSTIRWV